MKKLLMTLKNLAGPSSLPFAAAKSVKDWISQMPRDAQ